MEESAEHEPAWKKAGLKPGIQIWRIVKFKVTHWQQEDYGKFYDGDSYIILNTYKEEGNEQLSFDVHFWIGKHSTQDEYGTAAYKTVELDTYLDDAPIQHREVQGQESELFRSYFKNITYLHGGADSGFRHVKPEVIKTETETLEEETTSESDEFYTALDQADEDDFDSSSDFVSSKTKKELYREYDENFQSWFTAVATSFKSCLCQFDSCAPESTRSITEMLTSHQLDTCTIVSYALWGI